MEVRGHFCKRLRGGKFDLDDVWNRRSSVLNDSDSIKVRNFSAERLADYVYVTVYHPDSVDENKLLFAVAKFNFTSFLVRNFDIELQEDDGLHRMVISGFRSYDEAYQYARQLHDQKDIVPLVAKAKSFVVSVENLALIGSQFSYNDYEAFYKKHFAPIRVTTRYLLSEPAEVATPRERDIQEEMQSKAPTAEDMDAFDEQETPTIPVEEFVVEPTEEQAPAVPTVTETPVEQTGEEPAVEAVERETPIEPAENETPVTPIEEVPPIVPDDDTIIIDDMPGPSDDDFIPIEVTDQPAQQEEIFIFDEDEEAGSSDEYIDFDGF